jgi:protein gp37
MHGLLNTLNQKFNKMAQNSKIEWTHHTKSLWWGCTEVHEGCNNCYARIFSNRFNQPLWGNDKPRMEIKSFWTDIAKFQKLAEKSGEVHRVFINSMSDIFEKPMPVVDNNGNMVYCDNSKQLQTDTGLLRDEFFDEVIPKSKNLIFLLLTKRPSNINKYIPQSWKENSPKNVMFGTSPVNQATADKLVPQLLEVKGKKFLSVEPQLGTITFGNMLMGIDWVIQGGESGHNRRPFNLAWASLLRQECEYYNVPYFFKQIDKVQAIPDDLLIREFPIME